MKRLFLFLLLLGLLVCIGCRVKTAALPGQEPSLQKKEPGPTAVPVTGSVAAPESPQTAAPVPETGETPREGLYVVSVRDKATEPGVFTAQSLQLFYEDEAHYYYFPSLRSGLVIATLSDGSEMKVSEALEQGYMTIGELASFGVHFYTEPKTGDIPGKSDNLSGKKYSGK